MRMWEALSQRRPALVLAEHRALMPQPEVAPMLLSVHRGLFLTDWPTITAKGHAIVATRAISWTKGETLLGKLHAAYNVDYPAVISAETERGAVSRLLQRVPALLA